MRPLDPAGYDAWLVRAQRRMVERRAAARPDAAAVAADLIAQLLPTGLTSPDQHVLVGDGGEVWFTTGSDEAVLDLLGDPAVVLSAVHEVARAAGCPRMRLNVMPTEHELAAATGALGYQLIATRMRLPLGGRGDGEWSVVLRELDDVDGAAFAEALVASYAADLLASGAASGADVAAQRAREQTDEALVAPGSTVLGGFCGSDRVGTVWLDLPAGGDEAFVLDIVVAPGHRGSGHGRALMLAAQDHARDRGFRSMALSVFGDNAVARRLYDSLGYEVVETFVGIDLAETDVLTA